MIAVMDRSVWEIGGWVLLSVKNFFTFEKMILMKKFGLLAMLMLAFSPLAMHSVSANSDNTDVTSTTSATTSTTTDSTDGDALEENADEDTDAEGTDTEETSEEELDNDAEIDKAVNDALNTTEAETPAVVSPTPTEVKSVDTGIAGGAAAAALLLGGGALYANAKRRKED